MVDSGKSARPRAVSSAAKSTTSSIGAHRSHKSLVSSPHARTEIYEDSDDSDQDDDDEDDEDDEDDDDDEPPPTHHHQALPRSHTPGHLASKSVNDRTAGAAAAKHAAELAVRQRSQSASQVPPRPSTTGGSGTSSSSRSQSRPQHPPPPPPPPPTTTSDDTDKDGKRGGYTRTTSVLTSKSNAGPSSSRSTSAAVAGAALSQLPKGEHVAFPPLQDPKDAPDTAAAPASGMYWSRAPVSGAPHSHLRAHTTTLVGSNVYVFGGCDARACFNTVYVLDADAFYWSVPHVVGEVPAPLRAMTCTAVGRKLVVFGGGDGPAYYNDVYVLDTVNFRWTRPRVLLGDRGAPSRRRAHTACLYKNGIYVFGGGDGVRALNDIWRLDVSDMSKMSWRLVSGSSESDSTAAGKDQSPLRRPKARGYHTANMVGSKLIIYGGSDGGECFDDVWVYDVETHVWKAVSVPVTFRRLSHTATIVGSYLFVIGGHDGAEYCDDVLLLNLVTMTWDRRRVYGQSPTGRGYHGTVLHDSRLIMVGGFDGSDVFGDVHILELAVHAYYSQISHFTIEV